MNYPQQSAQGLASLGRGNDSMLVHMTPREVQGLQGLAMAHGGSLSINPQTGLPEAGILDFVLPVAASYFGVPPWLTASLMAGKTLIEGGDIGDAALTALSSYGGAKIGEGIKTFVDPIQQSTTAALNTANTAGSFVGQTGEMGSKLLSQSGGASQIGSNLGSVANEFGVNRPVADVFKESFKPDFAQSNFAPGFADNNLQGSFMGKDFSQPGMNQAGGTTTGYAFDTAAKAAPESNMISGIADQASKFPDQFGAAVKNPVDFARHIGGGDALYGGAKIGMYAASPFLEDILKPPAMEMNTSEAEKYDPNRRLYLRNDTKLRLLPNLNAKEGGYINGYAIGGPIQATSGSSVYGNPDGTIAQQTPKDDYGIGRLNNLASAQSINQASLTGYAMGGLTALKPGGYLDGQGDGMSDSIPATIEGKQPARLADGEFVVPADVVSHIGNGSSKAGSQRLYSMLDKVRKARTGNKKQGKQINPNKYMPA